MKDEVKAQVAQWLFISGGVLMVASLFFLSPYLRVFDHPKRHDIRKLYPRQYV
jgi:hypothetical protein